MWVELILTILGIPIVTAFTIITIKMSKSIKNIEVTANATIIENDYRKEFTEGYTLGIQKSIKTCKNGCSLIEFYPIDVEQGENIPRPTIQSFVVKTEYIKPFGTGELSDHRQRIKTITRNPFLIPEKMKDTTEGNWATKQGQLGWLKSEAGKTIPQGDEALAEFMKEQARGGMTKAELARLREVNIEYNKLKTMSQEQPRESESKTK